MADMEGTPVTSWHQFKDLAAAAEQVRSQPGRITAVKSLKGLGLLELPPAGYLSVDETQDDLLGVLGGFFGPAVDLRLCTMRADQVAGAVCDAQHRDRIPLVPDRGRPQVDVLVPDQPADKSELYVGGYGWVAFVRRPADCGAVDVPVPVEKTEDVTVYVAYREDTQTPESEYREGKLGTAEPIGSLTYPVGGWDYPGGEAALKAASLVAQSGPPMTVVALTQDADRAPLAALRATLFAASVDTGIGAPPVHAFRSTSGVEAIVLVFRIQIN
jgi:hypothetical protein